MIDLLISVLPLVGLFIAGYVLCLHTRDIDSLCTRIDRLEARIDSLCTRIDKGETRFIRCDKSTRAVARSRFEREADEMFEEYRKQREQDRKDGPNYGLDA